MRSAVRRFRTASPCRGSTRGRTAASEPVAPRAAMPSECVDGSSSRRRPSASVSQAGSRPRDAARPRRDMTGRRPSPCSRRSRARPGRRPLPRRCTSRRRRRAAARGRARASTAPRGGRARRAPLLPAAGRACVGPDEVRVVAERSALRSRPSALEPRSASSPASPSGGRSSAAIAKSARPPLLEPREEPPAASSRGRST